MSIDKIRLQNGCSIYNPQRVQRAASTIVKRNYHQTHAAYLRSELNYISKSNIITKS